MKRINAWIRDRLQALLPRRDEFLLQMNIHFEGFYSDWYRCTSDVATIGYGHTGSVIGLQPPPWTEAYARQVLRDELRDDYTPQAIEACCKVGLKYDKLSAAQQAAIVSACYNAGLGIILNGSWVQRFLQGKPRKVVEDAFYRWNKSGGKTSPGLVRRRHVEMLLFWEGRLDYDPPGWRKYLEAHK